MPTKESKYLLCSLVIQREYFREAMRLKEEEYEEWI
jgi:hypothetical protein